MRAVIARPDVLARLTAHARSRELPWMSAEDLVNEAIVRVLDGRCLWRPERQPDPVRHLGSIINSIAWDERTSARAHREAESVDDHDVCEADSGLTPDAAMIALEEERAEDARRKQRVSDLRRWLRGDKLALALLRLYEAGVVDANEQAALVGRGIATVYKARKRISYRAHH